MVAQVIFQNIGDAGLISRCCPHPQYIVVSPLKIEGMVVHQKIHDLVRIRSAVKNIPDDMQMIYGQPLDQLCQRNDKFIRIVNFQNGIQNFLVIPHLVIIFVFLHMQKLIDNIRKIFRHRLTHFRSCIFGRKEFGDFDQLIQDHAVSLH